MLSEIRNWIDSGESKYEHLNKVIRFFIVIGEIIRCFAGNKKI